MSRDCAVYDPANDPLAIPRNDKGVQDILDAVADESEQIDAICEARGWSRIDKNGRGILNAYLAGTVSVSDTVSRIAVPIESAYTSADHGRAFWDAERTARGARQAYDPEEAEVAEEDWGHPVAMCEPGPSPAGQFTTEDPLQPENLTPALRNDWIWKSGKLWSDLVMLGPSVRESWNDHPGGTMGFTLPEIHAWENENAFIAHLTAQGIANFMAYGVWAMRDALEGGIAHDQQMRNTDEMKARRIEVTLGVIIAWLHIAGKSMYRRIAPEQQINESTAPLSSSTDSSWQRSTEISARRWSFWKARLENIAEDDSMRALSRSHAEHAARLMQEIDIVKSTASEE